MARGKAASQDVGPSGRNKTVPHHYSLKTMPVDSTSPLCSGKAQFQKSDAISKNNSGHLRQFVDPGVAGKPLAMVYRDFLNRNLQLPAGTNEPPPKTLFHIDQERSQSFEQFRMSKNEWTAWII